MLGQIESLCCFPISQRFTSRHAAKALLFTSLSFDMNSSACQSVIFPESNPTSPMSPVYPFGKHSPSNSSLSYLTSLLSK